MSFVYKDGIGYGTNTKAAIYTDSGKSFTTVKDAPDYRNAEWSFWGDNNDEPNKIADDIENCGVLSAACESEARLAIGEGLQAFLVVDKDSEGQEIREAVLDSEIEDFMELNSSYKYAHGTAFNKIGYGWAATDLILNKKRDKINRIKAIDVYQARMKKKDKSGNITNLFLMADWTTAPSKYDADTIKSIPLLREGYELEDLEESQSGFEFAILHRFLKNGRGYYPTPMHRSAKAWVEITRSIPNIKKAINKNIVHVKYLITISSLYWEKNYEEWDNFPDEKRQEIKNKTMADIDAFLSGELNAGKTIVAGRYYDPTSKEFVPDIQIEVVKDNLTDGKLLPDSAAADKQILFSMMFNPAIWGGNLLGDGASGGAGSGSDIREATLVLLNLLHAERMDPIHTYNIIKKYNGWSKRLEKERDVFGVSSIGATANTSKKKITPRLVFRYPSTILTTLDKGSSTQTKAA